MSRELSRQYRVSILKLQSQISFEEGEIEFFSKFARALKKERQDSHGARFIHSTIIPGFQARISELRAALERATDEFAVACSEAEEPGPPSTPGVV